MQLAAARNVNCGIAVFFCSRATPTPAVNTFHVYTPAHNIVLFNRRFPRWPMEQLNGACAGDDKLSELLEVLGRIYDG